MTFSWVILIWLNFQNNIYYICQYFINYHILNIILNHCYLRSFNVSNRSLLVRNVKQYQFHPSLLHWSKRPYIFGFLFISSSLLRGGGGSKLATMGHLAFCGTMETPYLYSSGTVCICIAFAINLDYFIRKWSILTRIMVNAWPSALPWSAMSPYAKNSTIQRKALYKYLLL